VDQYGRALEIVAEVMRLGGATHREGEWLERPGRIPHRAGGRTSEAAG
jgi:hypothetical protein